MTIQLILPFPPSVNHYWTTRGKMRFLSLGAKKFRTDVINLAELYKRAEQIPCPIEGRVELLICVYPPDKRKRDLDNLAKGCMDALTHAGLYIDDSQVDKLTMIRYDIDAPFGHIEIFITEIDKI